MSRKINKIDSRQEMRPSCPNSKIDENERWAKEQAESRPLLPHMMLRFIQKEIFGTMIGGLEVSLQMPNSWRAPTFAERLYCDDVEFKRKTVHAINILESWQRHFTGLNLTIDTK